MPPRRLLAATIVCAAAALFTAPLAQAELRAEQITRATAPDLLIGGPDAVGGIGDWYLGNDLVEIIVDDPGRRHGSMNHGGTIVDAGRTDRTGEDQFTQLMPIVNLSQRVFLRFDTIQADRNEAEGWARLVVSSSRGLDSLPPRGWIARMLDPLVPSPEAIRGVFVETEYRVNRGEPYVHLTTTIRNRGTRAAPVFSYTDVLLLSERSMRAWLGHTLEPKRARGFQHRSFDVADILHAGEGFAPLTYTSVPGMRQFTGIAYALTAPDRVKAGHASFGVTDDQLTGMGAFLLDQEWRELSFWRLLRTTRSRLAAGAEWTYRRVFVIGDRADVASTTDVIFPLLGYADGTSGLTGRVAPADVPHVIIVTDPYVGAPITEMLTETTGPDAGRYRAVLPPGKYLLTVRAPQRGEQKVSVTVPLHEIADAGVQRLPEPGWLVFDPAFADRGPGRVVVQGDGATVRPVFEPELLGLRVDGKRPSSGTETHSLFFVGNATDPRRVAIPPGTYRLTATRGLEHGVTTAIVDVPGPGAEARVPPFQPPRVIDLPGYLTADFHVHAEASDDSGVANAVRLRTFVAERVDVLASTDHDHLGRYDDALDAVGVRDRIRVMHGSEVTSNTPSARAPWTIGHTNAWPLPHRPLEHRRGAPPNEDLKLAELYRILRHEHGAAVVQMNHPRRSIPGDISVGSFLTHLGSAGRGYDPDRPIHEAPNNLLLEPASDGHTRAIDFDAIEVLNGSSVMQFAQVRRDWYSFLKQGFRRTGTANSDTHAVLRPAGFPRNYVAYPRGLAGWDEAQFNQAVREGRTFGTTGPLFVRFTVNGGVMGDTVAASDGQAALGITVAAAPWVPVHEVRVVVNGDVVRTFGDLPHLEGAPVIRLHEDLTLPLEGDSFITLEAGVPLPEDPTVPPPAVGGVYGEVIVPGYVPVAFTNPVYVDVDGNGVFDPPGVPPGPKGWGLPIPLYVFGGVVVFMAIALLIARRQA